MTLPSKSDQSDIRSQARNEINTIILATDLCDLYKKFYKLSNYINILFKYQHEKLENEKESQTLEDPPVACLTTKSPDFYTFNNDNTNLTATTTTSSSYCPLISSSNHPPPLEFEQNNERCELENNFGNQKNTQLAFAPDSSNTSVTNSYSIVSSTADSGQNDSSEKDFGKSPKSWIGHSFFKADHNNIESLENGQEKPAISSSLNQHYPKIDRLIEKPSKTSGEISYCSNKTKTTIVKNLPKLTKLSTFVSASASVSASIDNDQNEREPLDQAANEQLSSFSFKDKKKSFNSSWSNSTSSMPDLRSDNIGFDSDASIGGKPDKNLKNEHDEKKNFGKNSLTGSSVAGRLEQLTLEEELQANENGNLKLNNLNFQNISQKGVGYFSENNKGEHDKNDEDDNYKVEINLDGKQLFNLLLDTTTAAAAATTTATTTDCLNKDFSSLFKLYQNNQNFSDLIKLDLTKYMSQHHNLHMNCNALPMVGIAQPENNSSLCLLEAVNPEMTFWAPDGSRHDYFMERSKEFNKKYGIFQSFEDLSAQETVDRLSKLGLLRGDNKIDRSLAEAANKKEEELNKLLGTKTKQQFYDSIVIGGLVAARYTVDNTFYRALVIDKFTCLDSNNPKTGPGSFKSFSHSHKTQTDDSDNDQSKDCHELELYEKESKSQKTNLQKLAKNTKNKHKKRSNNLGKLFNETIITVWFIDYGNYEQIDDLEDILPLHRKFTSYPAHAMPISFDRIKSCGESTNFSLFELTSNSCFKTACNSLSLHSRRSQIIISKSNKPQTKPLFLNDITFTKANIKNKVAEREYTKVAGKHSKHQNQKSTIVKSLQEILVLKTNEIAGKIDKEEKEEAKLLQDELDEDKEARIRQLQEQQQKQQEEQQKRDQHQNGHEITTYDTKIINGIPNNANSFDNQDNSIISSSLKSTRTNFVRNTVKFLDNNSLGDNYFSEDKPYTLENYFDNILWKPKWNSQVNCREIEAKIRHKAEYFELQGDSPIESTNESCDNSFKQSKSSSKSKQSKSKLMNKMFDKSGQNVGNNENKRIPYKSDVDEKVKDKNKNNNNMLDRFLGDCGKNWDDEKNGDLEEG